MIEAARRFIEEGFFQFFVVDSVDGQSWTHPAAHPAERARRHEDYDRYIVYEVAPRIHLHQHQETPLLATGCSMAAITPAISSSVTPMYSTA